MIMKTINKKYLISAPTKSPDNACYKVECEFTMEPELVRLVGDAVEAGWDELVVAFAITSLCERYIYGPDEQPLVQ